MDRPSNRPRVTRGPVSGVWFGLAGLVITALLTAMIWRDAVQHDEERLAVLTEQLWQELETRVESYERELSQLAEWFAGRTQVTGVEWENRVERMKLPVNFPALTEVLFAETIRPPKESEQPPDPADLNGNRAMIHRGWDFEVRLTAVRSLGATPDGTIPRLSLDPPQAGRRLMAELDPERLNQIGGNLSVRSTRRRLIEPGGSAAVPAFTLFAGIHDRSMPAASAIDEPSFDRWHGLRNLRRLESLRGVVAGTVATGPLVESIFGDRRLEADFDLYAGELVETNRLTRQMQAPVAPRRGLGVTKEVRWYGDRWHFVTAPNDRFFFGSRRFRAGLVAIAGTLLSLLLAGFVHTQTRARAAAEAWSRELEEAREQLRTAHSEREQFGRNLHDGVLQSLYAAVLSLRRAGRATAVDPGRAGVLIEGVVSDLEESMQTIRGFLTNAPAGQIAAVDLPAQLRGYVDACRRMALAEVSISGDPVVLTQLHGDHAEQVLLLVKEAVSNAHRHGQAAHIEIRCERVGSALQLTVSDDGRGFVPDNVTGPGYGLRSMRERMEHCGGRLGVDSRPGGPTTVRATVPLRPEKRTDA